MVSLVHCVVYEGGCGGWELRLVCVHVGLGVEIGLCTCWGWELRLVCAHVGLRVEDSLFTGWVGS